MQKIVKRLFVVFGLLSVIALLVSCSKTNIYTTTANQDQSEVNKNDSGDDGKSFTNNVAENIINVPSNAENSESESITQEQEDSLHNYSNFQLLEDCFLPGGNPDNSFHLQYDEEFPPENLWLSALEKGTGNDNEQYYVAVGLDGTYLGAINKKEYYIVSPFFDGVSCVFDGNTGEKRLINTNMEDVTALYVDSQNDEQVVGVGSDKTGITLWTRKNTDTYDSHSTELFAKDLSGNIKQTWSSRDEITENIENILSIEHINGANYVYCYFDNYVILNVETGKTISVGELHSDIQLYELFEDGSYLSTINSRGYANLTWHLPTGEISKEINLYGDVAISDYGEGLMYVRGEIDDTQFEGFVDQSGIPLISLDVKLNVTNYPVFRGEYALLELENQGGETFITLLDKSGEFAFEPIKGKVWSDLMGRTYRGDLEGNQYYFMKDDSFYYLYADGSTKKIEYDFQNCRGFLGKTYIISTESFEIVN